MPKVACRKRWSYFADQLRTAMWKKLSVDVLEGVFLYHSIRTFLEQTNRGSTSDWWAAHIFDEAEHSFLFLVKRFENLSFKI